MLDTDLKTTHVIHQQEQQIYCITYKKQTDDAKDAYISAVADADDIDDADDADAVDADHGRMR